MLKEKIVIVDPAKKQQLVSEVEVRSLRNFSIRSLNYLARALLGRSTS